MKGELQQGFVGTEEWAQEAELAVHLAMAFLRRLPAGEAGVVGNAIEELGVEFLEEGGAIFAGTYEQAGGEFFSNLVMMAEVFGTWEKVYFWLALRSCISSPTDVGSYGRVQ